MRLLGIVAIVCSTAMADPKPPLSSRRTMPVTRQLKPAPKTPKQTSASYHRRLTPMPLRSGF